MLEKVIENWTSRLDYIRASRGSPMPEIIFKMPMELWGAGEKGGGKFRPQPRRSGRGNKNRVDGLKENLRREAQPIRLERVA
ncbi:hypothetical protein TNCV_148071 [Trichonephila clavipes]|nr:hypothetical protein TNCV_148071 [Trichonephila clavipes]